MNNLDKPTAHIDEWVYDGNVIFGHIIKHNRQSDFKRTYQMTSMVQHIDMVEGYAETLNTYYTLGEPGKFQKIKDQTISEQLAGHQKNVLALVP